MHTSPVVHASPSSQASALLAWTQPVAVLHESLVQGSESSQSTAKPGWQLPNEHASPLVQALPSVQATVLSPLTQPVVMLQLSVVQTLPSSQLIAPPDTQAPATQASPEVQALPSVQASVLLANTQPLDGAQLSVVHGLLSLQASALPGWQAPAAQTSPVVHALLSEQVTVLLL